MGRCRRREKKEKRKNVRSSGGSKERRGEAPGDGVGANQLSAPCNMVCVNVCLCMMCMYVCLCIYVYVCMMCIYVCLCTAKFYLSKLRG